MKRIGVLVFLLTFSYLGMAKGGGGGGHASGHASAHESVGGHGEEESVFEHTSEAPRVLLIPHGSITPNTCVYGVASSKVVSASQTVVTCNNEDPIPSLAVGVSLFAIIAVIVAAVIAP